MMQDAHTAYAPSPVGLEPGVAWDENHPCARCGRPAWAHGEPDGACPPKDDELAQPGHGGIRGMRPLDNESPCSKCGRVDDGSEGRRLENGVCDDCDATPVNALDDLDRERMVELARDVLRASTDFERGYHTGRFEEYASQNAIDPDLFPALRYEAARQLDEAAGL